MMSAKSVENSKEGALHLIKKSLERLVSNPTTSIFFLQIQRFFSSEFC